ncbi:NIPSNAP family protein [Micromonospora sp. C51]|uniref:NIPSNAP family protein n=1 Tax=Micromonospora sp. C51 TaxID=2824879 RepID=UPI001B39006E|nr:NIPSNAP family protein [Micromonospora sp. C51]MBQ1052179.1 NIPSNAP family protein [Micromonospora sp. C51]
MRTVQIRTYSVRQGRLDEWVRAWQTLVVPLRREFGFEVHGSWVDRERDAHIWVISYDGDQSFEDANAAYWASPQREQLGVDPAEFLIDEEVRTVEQVL